MNKVELSVEGNSAEEINAALAQISRELARRPLSVYTSAYSAAVAGDPFTVTHTLGYVPDSALSDVTDEMIVWATAADRAVWTSTQIVLRANVTNTLVKVKLEKY
jgi:hypothetical protein